MELLTLGLLIFLILEVSYLLFTLTKRTPHSGRKKVFIDTSALMDGRIVTAARTGFIPDTLVVPQSVIAELQHLADKADGEKRTRARRGLDAISELQEIKEVSLMIIDDGPVGEGGVDARLVELARREKQGLLCTIDFNLNKVATVNGVKVLNINELAGSIRMAFLPGETMSLPLTQKGQGDNQAIGYLADGTMVVVDKALKSVGKTVQIEFIRSLQTAAGRMMFAKLVNDVKDSDATSTPKSTLTNKASIKGKGRKAVTQQPANEPRATKNANTKRSKKPTASSREDSLLELVNSQD